MKEGRRNGRSGKRFQSQCSDFEHDVDGKSKSLDWVHHLKLIGWNWSHGKENKISSVVHWIKA